MKFAFRFVVVFCVWFASLSSLAQGVDPKIDSLISLITIDSYQSHFDSLRTGPLHTRKVKAAPQQSADHDACRDYTYRSFQQYLGNENTYIHHFNIGRQGGLANVIGVKQGTDPNGGIWVVSAHYDSQNANETRPNEADVAPGANDNGTGLAALLEIARILSQVETVSTFVFAAWDYEEVFTDGLPTGSNKWFNDHVKKRKPTQLDKLGNGGTIKLTDFKGNINFDMIGKPHLYNDSIPIVWVCYAYSGHSGFTDHYSEIFNRYIDNVEASSYGRLIFSDHYTFAARRIPALVNLQSDYLHDKYYHTYSDHNENPDNINYNYAVSITRGGLAFILEKQKP
jgi:hypothetical protein